MRRGFINLSREIAYTDWYKDFRTFGIMLHLIFLASFEPEYKRENLFCNQVKISLNRLSQETGLTLKQVREAIGKLLYMRELEKTVIGQDCIYNIVNFDEYVELIPDG